MLLSGPGGNLLMSIYVVSNQFIPLPPHGQSPVSLLTHKALLSRLPASKNGPVVQFWPLRCTENFSGKIFFFLP